MPIPHAYHLSTLSGPAFLNTVTKWRERESACSQWIFQGMADGTLRGRWLLDRWVGANLILSLVNLGMVNCITNLDHLGEFA